MSSSHRANNDGGHELIPTSPYPSVATVPSQESELGPWAVPRLSSHGDGAVANRQRNLQGGHMLGLFRGAKKAFVLAGISLQPLPR